MSSLLEPTVPQHSADAISDPSIKHFLIAGFKMKTKIKGLHYWDPQTTAGLIIQYSFLQISLYVVVYYEKTSNPTLGRRQ